MPYKVSALKTLTAPCLQGAVSHLRRHSLRRALAAGGIFSPPIPAPVHCGGSDGEGEHCVTKCSVCSLSHGQTAHRIACWRGQEGMAPSCLFLPSLLADLQGNRVAWRLQLLFPSPFSPVVLRGVGKHIPWDFAGWIGKTVKPQISSEGSGKGQELGSCVTVGSVKHLSGDMFVCLGFFYLLFFKKL